jgi:hypothetical protein
VAAHLQLAGAIALPCRAASVYGCANDALLIWLEQFFATARLIGK